jgi:hypothetical protein
MLATVLINVLGVATWYLLGAAYISTAARHWPYKEEYRGKWLPWDVREAIEADPDTKHIAAYPEHILRFVLTLAFLMNLTVWPVSVYMHAKRQFRTGPGKHAK